MPDVRIPLLASAMAWNAAWCSRTPSIVTHSRSLAMVLLTLVSQAAGPALATAGRLATTNTTTKNAALALRMSKTPSLERT